MDLVHSVTDHWPISPGGSEEKFEYDGEADHPPKHRILRQNTVGQNARLFTNTKNRISLVSPVEENVESYVEPTEFLEDISKSLADNSNLG
jgi:hypothetical protein